MMVNLAYALENATMEASESQSCSGSYSNPCANAYDSNWTADTYARLSTGTGYIIETWKFYYKPKSIVYKIGLYSASGTVTNAIYNYLTSSYDNQVSLGATSAYTNFTYSIPISTTYLTGSDSDYELQTKTDLAVALYQFMYEAAILYINETINLINPVDDNYSVNLENNYTFYPEMTASTPMVNCSIWTNYSGVWQRNITNQTPIVNHVIAGIYWNAT